MRKILILLLVILFNSSLLAADDKPGRFFEDQPDVTDDYQIKKLNQIKQKPDKKISWKLRYSTSCRYRDWERAKGGYYIWGVEDNIAAR